MNDILKRLIQVLGGIMIMILIAGCNLTSNQAETPSTTVTSNHDGATRTAEEAAVEAQFEPLFQFLAEEKKDLSKLKRYYSSYSKDEVKEDELIGHDYHVVRFDELDTSFDGSYIVTKEEETTTYPVVFDPAEGVIGRDTISLHPLVMQTADLSVLKNYPVTSVLAKHPKTELTTISYEVDEKFPLLKAVIEELGLEGVTSASVRLSRSFDEYSYQLTFVNEDFVYVIDTLIKLK